MQSVVTGNDGYHDRRHEAQSSPHHTTKTAMEVQSVVTQHDGHRGWRHEGAVVTGCATPKERALRFAPDRCLCQAEGRDSSVVTKGKNDDVMPYATTKLYVSLVVGLVGFSVNDDTRRGSPTSSWAFTVYKQYHKKKPTTHHHHPPPQKTTQKNVPSYILGEGALRC